MSEADDIVLRCAELHRYLGQGEGRVHVLKGVSFEARRGHVYAIVGPSGCGKSTLLYLLGLLDQPDAGRIWIDGELMSSSADADRTAARGEHIGFVFQFHYLLPEFNALENVMMPGLIAGLPKANVREDAVAMLEMLGLSDRILHRTGELSGGEQQRVAIARALVTRPSIVMAGTGPDHLW